VRSCGPARDVRSVRRSLRRLPGTNRPVGHVSISITEKVRLEGICSSEHCQGLRPTEFASRQATSQRFGRRVFERQRCVKVLAGSPLLGTGRPRPTDARGQRKRNLGPSTIRATWRRQRGQGTAPARLADSEVSHGEITRRQTRSTGLPGAGDAVDPVVDVGLAVVPDRVFVEPARSDAPTGAPARNPSRAMEAAPRIRSPPTFRGAALREITFWSAIRSRLVVEPQLVDLWRYGFVAVGVSASIARQRPRTSRAPCSSRAGLRAWGISHSGSTSPRHRRRGNRQAGWPPTTRIERPGRSGQRSSRSPSACRASGEGASGRRDPRDRSPRERPRSAGRAKAR
jgi:hypothetical protein